MSAPPRLFLLRFTLALLGMLLLMAVVFAGLGWLVSREYGRVVKVVGEEKADRLAGWYGVFMANLMPRDLDGDGVCDGAELFMRTDPRNPKSFPDFGISYAFPDTNVAYCGERVTICWYQYIVVGNVRLPLGFKAVVAADEPVLLPKNGVGSPTKGPLVVTVNEHGEVEFDILAEKAFSEVGVDFESAANKDIFSLKSFLFPGWRTPPIPVSVDGGPPRAAFPRWVPGMDPDWFHYSAHEMKWMALSGWAGIYVIEAAREDCDDKWQPVPVQFVETECKFGADLWGWFPGYTGGLKFRVVPVSLTPPESSPPR